MIDFKFIDLFFEQFKTNTAFVGFLTAILTLIITQIANYFFIRHNTQMEIRKLFIKKSINAHEELIKLLYVNKISVSSELNPVKRYIIWMETKEECILFYSKLRNHSINFSHLYNKELGKELDELLKYLQLLVSCCNKDGFDDSLLQKWGDSLRDEIFFKFSNIQEKAEKFLYKGIWSLEIKPYQNNHKAYSFDEVEPTMLYKLYNDLLSNELAKK